MNLFSKHLLVVFCFLLFSPSSFSQTTTTTLDSLQNQLQIHTQKDTVRVTLLNKMASLYYQKDIVKANEYVKEAQELAKTIGFTKRKWKKYVYKGVD